jgi:hypothetical protein
MLTASIHVVDPICTHNFGEDLYQSSAIWLDLRFSQYDCEDYNCLGRNTISLSSSVSNSTPSKELTMSVPVKRVGFYQPTQHCNQEDWNLLGYYLMHRFCRVDTRQILNYMISPTVMKFWNNKTYQFIWKSITCSYCQRNLNMFFFCICGLGNLAPAVCSVLFELCKHVET